MGYPAQTAQPDPARKSQAEPNLHIGPSSGLREGARRANRAEGNTFCKGDRDRQSDWPGNIRAFAVSGRARAVIVDQTVGPGRASGRGFPVTLFPGRPEARPGLKNA